MEPENVAVSSAGEGIKNEEAASVSGSDLDLGVEIVSEKEKEIIAVNLGTGQGKKSSARRSNGSPAKRKVKVDWTPELHKRFVEAVERLGLDKAVPSRILELMGIDCLTRHNIASHLQKYRSHRKNVLAREAEATTWNQRRKNYGGLGARKEVNPWIAPPSIGYPPVMPATHFRPLHVWGHPSVDQSLMHMWPKHVAPPPPWPLSHSVPPFPPPDASYWHSQHQFVPAAGTPWYPLHSPQMRSPTQAFPNVLPHDATYKVDHQPPSDVPPSNESIDAAIGEVLARPWLPLPLGLKPPSVDSVMVELKHQGISRIPPSNCS